MFLGEPGLYFLKLSLIFLKNLLSKNLLKHSIDGEGRVDIIARFWGSPSDGG